MGKRVILIASGETERRALPHLVQPLRDHGVIVDDVRIPPRNKVLNLTMAEKLIKSAWYENLHAPPAKFVMVMDLDGSKPDEILGPIRKRLSDRLGQVKAQVLYAYAQQHLEAWYFADAANLRKYLCRNLGRVDTSKPDKICNPKLHLKQLLEKRVYTARISEEIAKNLDTKTIAGRSPSFKNFVDAIMNGDSAESFENSLSGSPSD